jgi:hypothetical protein
MHRYSPREIKFLEKKIKGRAIAELTELFNRHFGLEQTVAAIRYVTFSRGLTNGLHRKYTPAQIRFIESKIDGRSVAEMTTLFNKRFGLSITEGKIKCFMANHKLRNGRDCRFQPGQVSHNKGLKGYYAPGSEKGWFRPGNIPLNYKPVGTKRINTQVYVEMKIADPNKWKMKHVIIWEKANGLVPKGHVVIFADGNRLNITLKNLLMVSRAELAVMNHCGLIYDRPEFTKTGKLIADIKIGIADRKRGIRHRSKKKRSKS